MATMMPLTQPSVPKPADSEADDRFLLSIDISPRRVALTMGAMALALVGAHIVCQFLLKLYLGYDNVLGLVPYLHLGLENNLPTWYSSATLLFCGGLLALIAARARATGAPHDRAWAVLALVFAFLSLDEATGLHERLNQPTREYVGRVFNAWVIPASIVLLVGALAAGRFVLDLPPRTRRLVVAAAVLFVSGALGLEAAAGAIRTVYLYDPEIELTLLVMTTAEELLEMLGIVVFAYALLDHLGRQWRPIPAAFRAPRVPRDTTGLSE